MSSTRTRTRLSPVARKDQLLDSARQMIVESGLQNFTMEGLARAAEVSSPLVYNYFKSRKILLRALVAREFQAYAENLNAQVAAAESFEDVVRISIASNFDHYAHGNILPILQSQPEIAGSINASRVKYGKQMSSYLVQNAAKNYKLTKSQAALVVHMSSGASIAAAEYAALSGGDRSNTIDTALSYILACLTHVAGQDP